LELRRPVDEFAVDEGAIAAAKVLAGVTAIARKQLCVLARDDRAALEHQVAFGVPTDDVQGFGKHFPASHRRSADHFDVAHNSNKQKAFKNSCRTC